MSNLDLDWKKQYVAAIKKGMVPQAAALAFASKTLDEIRMEMVNDDDFREQVEAFDKSSSHHVSLPALPNTDDIRELAAAVENDVFMVYYHLMMSDTTPASVRKSCCDALADRSRGKPQGETLPMAPPIMVDTIDIARHIAYMFAQAESKGHDLKLPFLEAEVIEEDDEDDVN